MSFLRFLFLLIMLPLISYAQQQKEIAYVSMEVILSQYAPAIKAMSDIESKRYKYQAKHDSMLFVLDQLHAELNQKIKLLSNTEREAEISKIMFKEEELEKFRRHKFTEPGGELARYAVQAMKPVRKKISAAIDKLRIEQGYKFVFNKTSDGELLSADTEYDLTLKVLDYLKKEK